MITIHQKSFEVYISEERIAKATKQVAVELMKDYGDSDPVFIGVLNGAFMFFSDLMKNYTSPCQVGFVKAASYEGMKSTNAVKFHDAGKLDIRDKDVVVIEDIVDTGQTLKSLYDHLGSMHPRSIKVCTLLFKKEAYKESLSIDYVCFETENKFLLGYGLDYDGYGRNIPEVYILKD